MSALEAAEARLAEALERLERALAATANENARLAAERGQLERALEDAGVEREALLRDVAGLRGECQRLNDLVESAKRDNDQLLGINDQIAQRLDGAIAELQALLEEG